MKRILTLFTLMALLVTTSWAQQRYIDEVFSSVSVQRDVAYGLNATVLALPVVGQAIPQPLLMNVYTPDGDTETQRPLVLYFHTGNFLPHPDNGSTGGTRDDSTAVEIATRLAKMGYVVAVCTYRFGWNPIASDQTTRVFTLINAAYRGVQDARTAVKFFKRNAAEAGNTYGIDPSKVVIWGQGTGGYISLNTASLDEYIEIPLTPGGKFTVTTAAGPIPMIIEGINGDINCDSVGIVPPGGFPPGFPVGDTLNYPNHVGYSGDFQLAVNMGGALGDTSWIDQGQPPIISFQVPTDPFAPYNIGLVIVPGFNLPVVEVFGAYQTQLFQNRYGNNDAFAGKTYPGDYSDVANSRNDGYDGLFPIIGTAGPADSGPWEWWDPATNVNHANGILSNPDMSAAKARSYIDTMIAYYAPRACEVLGLSCGLVAVEKLNPEDMLTVAPVPAQQSVFVSSRQGDLIRSIYVYDLSGRLVKVHVNVDDNQFQMNRDVLANGSYIMQVHFDKGVATRKIMFN